MQDYYELHPRKVYSVVHSIIYTRKVCRATLHSSNVANLSTLPARKWIYCIQKWQCALHNSYFCALMKVTSE